MPCLNLDSKRYEKIFLLFQTAHLRSFCDVLVMEFAKSHPTGHVNKCIDAMNNLIWKYNIIALDRLILCMALRTNEGTELLKLWLFNLLFKFFWNTLIRKLKNKHFIWNDLCWTCIKWNFRNSTVLAELQPALVWNLLGTEVKSAQ